MNYYKRAIEIIAHADAKELMFKVASENPGAIVRAVDGTKMHRLRSECIELIKSDRKIGAVKLWKEVTGAGLQEAKDAVEDLMEEVK